MLGGIIGGISDIFGGNRAAEKNITMQYDAMTKGIQYRVKDALKAGINPIFALGAPPFNPSPVSNDAVGQLGALGQNLDRAVRANQTERERQRENAALEIQNAVQRERDNEIHGLTVERMRLENMGLAAQLSQINQGTQLGPATPSAARTRTTAPGSVDEIPATVVVGSRGNPSREPGAITDFQFTRVPGGGLAPVMSEQMKERTEDDLFAQVPFYLRHLLGRGIGGGSPDYRPNPRDFPLPSGQSWEWDWDRQAYFPFDRNRGWRRDGQAGSRSPGPRETLDQYRRRRRTRVSGGGGL